MSAPLSKTVVRALCEAKAEMEHQESWVAGQEASAMVVSHVVSLLAGVTPHLSRRNQMPEAMRYYALRAMAYLPVSVRMAALIDLSSKRPEALNALLCGPLSAEGEIYRFNVIRAVGVFARHGLIEEVYTPDRVKAVSDVIDGVRARRASRSASGAAGGGQ